MRLSCVACALLALVGCVREDPLALAPPAERSVDERARWLEKPQVGAHLFDRFTQADLLSAANSRFGTVELNLTAKVEAALDAAREARTYLELASERAAREGHAAVAEYERRAAGLLLQAAEAAKAGDGVRAQEMLGAARRALDMAIEQSNSVLVPPPPKSA